MALGPVPIYCANGQCGAHLGQVALSVLGSNVNAVWQIQPGWSWKGGILERSDETYVAERRLLHELTGKSRPTEGLALAREANLPICVRCPKCHRMRWVAPDVLFTRA